PWAAPLNVVRFTQPPYGTFDAAEWAPSTASIADISQVSLLILERAKEDRLAAFLVGTSAARIGLTTMTYKSYLRSDIRDDNFYRSWIIGGGIVLAIVIAALAFMSTGNYLALEVPQIITTAPAPTSSTTASNTTP